MYSPIRCRSARKNSTASQHGVIGAGDLQWRIEQHLEGHEPPGPVTEPRTADINGEPTDRLEMIIRAARRLNGAARQTSEAAYGVSQTKVRAATGLLVSEPVGTPG